MTDDTFQFTASGAQPLEPAVREAMAGAADGRPPARKRVRAWIVAGDVQVEGRPIRDPTWVPAAGDRVVVAPGGAEGPVAGASAAGGAGAGCAASIRHLDRHLVVAEWDPPLVVGTDAVALSGWLRAGLEESGVKGLCPRPVPDPVLRVGGLVAAALSPVAEAHLSAALGEGRLRLELTALAAAGPDADTEELVVTEALPGVLRVVRTGTVGAGEALADLRARGLVPLAAPGPGPEARRPLLAHVSALAFPHPTTGRDLAWTSTPPS